MKLFFWLALLALPAAAMPLELAAQDAIPIGVIIPARLDSTFSTNSKPGEKISARVMQDVPLDDRQKIRAGSLLVGHIVSVGPAEPGPGTEIAIVFDELLSSGKKFPVSTELRALASPREVEKAQTPIFGSDPGTSPSAYTTLQIGGEIVYRGGGQVRDRFEAVGKPAPGGILGAVRANIPRGCDGPAEGRGRPQALWLFSTSACGVYDIENLDITRSEGQAAAGEIELSSKGQLKVASGSALLLRVIASDDPTT